LLVLWLDSRPLQRGARRLRGADVRRLLGRPQAQHSPYPAITRAEMRAGLDLLPTWVLETKAAANRRLIAVMRQRLAAGEQVARMYQEPGLAWLERQAEVAEDLVAERQTIERHTD
jgi:hypothetical protein